MKSYLCTAYALVLLIVILPVRPALAADECGLSYSYATASGSLVNASHYLDANETLELNQQELRKVENINDYPVRVQINTPYTTFKKWVTLDSDGDVDPPVGTYFGSITLFQVHCPPPTETGGGFATPQQMIEALIAAGTPLADIAQQLAETFNLGLQQVAEAMQPVVDDGDRVARALKQTFNATAQQVLEAMRQAGFTTAQIVDGLRAEFNASAQQIAGWMRSAGYTAQQVADAIRAEFNASAAQVASWMREAGFTAAQIADAVRAEFNAAGAEVASWLRQAGFTAGEVYAALVAEFNASGQQAVAWMIQAGYTALEMAQTLKEVSGTTVAEAVRWLYQAGVQGAEIAAALKRGFNAAAFDLMIAMVEEMNATGAELARWFRQARFTADQARLALERAFQASAAQVNAWLQAAGYAVQTTGGRIGDQFISISFIGHGTSDGFVSRIQWYDAHTGVAFPLYEGENQVAFRGGGLDQVTGIDGLPPDAQVRIVNVVRPTRNGQQMEILNTVITMPARAIGGNGESVLRTRRGPASSKTLFRWYGASRSTNPGGGRPGRGTGGGGGAQADLQPTAPAPSLYKVGTATTLDVQGNLYTALEPFNNSAFCQAIPEPAASRAGNNANQRTVTVPNIQWGVRNPSTVDINTPFNAVLRQGNQVVATQQVQSLRAGQTQLFTYVRPQSQVCVAKVGLGGGCYHCGPISQGWNDNPGYTIEVDAGNAVPESSEVNNRSTL